MGKYNDMEIKDWKKYTDDITTDSLWISRKDRFENYPIFLIPKRDFLPKPDNKFHGIFIPEIPYQFIKRFTKEGEIVWDPMAGSGTTHKVAQLLNRKCISSDLTPQKDFILQGDARFFNPNTNVQMIILHPPYHNIIKYSTKKEDGSNQNTVDNYLQWFEEVVKNINQFLDKNRFLILICGNIYLNGEEHTLGVWCKDIVKKSGFKLKSQIIKDYGETKGGFGSRTYNLEYYRQLKFNYNSFYGDNIFILQKTK